MDQARRPNEAAVCGLGRLEIPSWDRSIVRFTYVTPVLITKLCRSLSGGVGTPLSRVALSKSIEHGAQQVPDPEGSPRLNW